MEHSFAILEFDKIRRRLSDYAASPLGAEAAVQIEPTRDDQLVQRRQQETTEMRDLQAYDQPVPLDGLPDIRPLLQRLQPVGSLLQIEELIRLRQMLAVAGRLQSYFAQRREKIPVLSAIVDDIRALPPLEKEIDRCIDSHSGSIRDDASPDLARIRRQLLRLQAQARTRIERLLQSYGSQGMLQEQIVAVRNGRLVLVVKDEYKRQVRGLVHDRSATGSSCFIEPFETVEDNNRLRELEAQEYKEIERILAALSDFCRKFLPAIETDVKALAQLDLVFARAGLSAALNAHAPEFSESVELFLAQARHPLLLLRTGESRVVPLDLELSGQERICVISGPNAGGKTVALKTAGLLVLMARAGLHIPALPHSKIGRIERVFAAIGDEQSLENDLSTFSSHLRRLKEIVDQATANSLVLVDEIGSGTDPDEGSALAMSVLEHLVRLSCLCVVTTHQSALKAFAYETTGVANGSMEFDIQTLQPTYRFRKGVPGSSYAFEIAQRLGLAEPLIVRARELVGSHKDKFEGLILQLEAELSRVRELKRESSIKETELRGLTHLYSEKIKEIRKHERRLKKEAVVEAESILRDANSTVERAVREIRENAASREAIRTARSRLEEQTQSLAKERRRLDELEKKTPKTPSERIVVGDSVRWEKIEAAAVVLTEPDKRGRVQIQAGAAKIMVPLNELVRLSGSKSRRRGMVKLNLSESGETGSDQVDLRGMTSSEATAQVDKFIDSALLVGFHEIRIIHGKGTGKLRKDISRFLQEHPRVVEYRLGYWNEGDSGVTVVTLVKDRDQGAS
ncbi:endonuclease MutS2 [candidate division KSB1 bacterium]|nr:endonuclease MutS2 [candidate division KSB1 bacterium]